VKKNELTGLYTCKKKAGYGKSLNVKSKGEFRILPTGRIARRQLSILWVGQSVVNLEKKEKEMIKRISTVAIAGLLALPALASAGSSSDASSIESIERQMQEMSKMFNSQINALKEEVADLKSKNDKMSKELSNVAAMPVTAPPEAKPSWTDSVSIGGEVRAREYYFNNFNDSNDDNDFDRWDVMRHKASIWVQVDPTDKVSGYVKISDQNYGEGVTSAKQWEENNKSNKMFIDNAYIDVKEMFDLPVAARIGRQDVMYGSGFVLFDGTSWDASTAYYLDGVKLGWSITDNVLLDGLYFKEWEGNRDNINNDDITLGGGYLTVKKCPLTGAKDELYALNRADEILKKDIWMYGLRISDKFDCGFDYSLEGAIQKGDAYEDTVTDERVDQDALGYKLGAGYTFKNTEMKPRAYLGYTFFSGDEDANDDENERWDVFYGGWPQFGDIISWKYLNLPGNIIGTSYDPTYNKLGHSDTESGIGENIYSNFSIATIGVSADLFKNLSADLSYSLLTADETAPGYDDDIGDVYQLSLKYKYNPKLTFSLYWGIIEPGDAFDNPTTAATEGDDTASEFFIEADFKF
jgi:hypothetical protein